MRHPVASLVILPAIACHPVAHSARQPLAPDSAVEPIVACVRSALADAPNVKEARFKKDYPRTVYVIFLNPPDPQAGGMELVVAPTSGTPSQFVVAYTLWTGNLTKPGVPNLAKLNAPSVEATAAQLLRAAHNQCAPTAAGQPACSMSNFDERITGRCSVGI
jgi:hypothetical protein